MNSLNYVDVKAALSEDFTEFTDSFGYSKEQAFAALLEDNVLMMKKSNDYYVSVIVAISIIGLESDIIADYIYKRLLHLMEHYLDDYNDRQQVDFLTDLAYLENRLYKRDYTKFYDNDYEARMDRLFGKK